MKFEVSVREIRHFFLSSIIALRASNRQSVRNRLRPGSVPCMASWRWAFRCLFKSMVREHEVLEKVVAAEEAEKDERGLRRAFGETDVAAAGWGVEATAQQMYAGRPRAQPTLLRALRSRVLRFAHRPSLSSKSHRGRHDWMADEDLRRDELFKKPLPPAPRRPSTRAIPPGAHAGFQLARTACRRVYCCGACGVWLARCQDVVPVAERVCDMSLDDCAVTVCVASADVRNARKREIGAGGDWSYAANDVRCSSCDAFLGIRLNSMRRSRGAISSGAHAAVLEALLGDAQGVRVSPPRMSSSAYVSWRRQQEGGSRSAVSGVIDETSSGSRSEITSSGASSSPCSVSQYPSPTLTLREEGDSDGDGANSAVFSSARGGAAAAAAVIAAAAGFGEGGLWGSGSVSTPHAPAVAPLPPAPLAVQGAPAVPFASDGVRVDQILLGTRYLRVLDTHTNRLVTPLVPLRCRQCARTLSYTDQLLCTRRRWGFGRTTPQPACFVNSVVSSSVEVRSPYEEQLAQGMMLMADVFCRCGCQVGYKFCGDRTPSQRNLNQVGRFGLVCSTFAVAPYQIVYPRVDST